jgi:hypothetical protein
MDCSTGDPSRDSSREYAEVLRLRNCFASRNSYCAQDDIKNLRRKYEITFNDESGFGGGVVGFFVRNWVQCAIVVLVDLLVLTEMALNIASLVATLQSGKQLNARDATAIQNSSAEASRDLMRGI